MYTKNKLTKLGRCKSPTIELLALPGLPEEQDRTAKRSELDEN